MNDLIQSAKTIDSREVAEMIGKTHAHLCRDIQGYIEVISENPILDSQNYFIPKTYKVDGNNKTYPCYELTKMGCEMVANKLTGEKGILFTAMYVKRFNDMESKPMTQAELIAANAMQLVEQERELKAIRAKQEAQAQELQGMRDVLTITSESWRKETTNLINKIAQKRDDDYMEVRRESYKALDERMGVSVEIRLKKARDRMLERGYSKSQINKLNVLDIIDQDKKLVAGYLSVVKDMAIKYGVA